MSETEQLVPKRRGGLASVFKNVFLGYKDEDRYDLNVTQDAGVQSVPARLDPAAAESARSGDVGTADEVALRELPVDRYSRYNWYQKMEQDPTISSAIKQHLANALMARTEDGKIVTIEGVTDEGDPLVEELKDRFEDEFNRNLNAYAYPMCTFGTNFVQVHGARGVGIQLLRHDFYTHPFHTKKYERAGNLVGFTSRFQQLETGQKGSVRLMEPWRFVEFKIPHFMPNHCVEPVRLDGSQFNIANEDLSTESLVESQDYGTSLLEGCFGPWLDLHEGLKSLSMSRRNASRIDRYVTAAMEGGNPTQAAAYIKLLNDQLKKDSDASLERSTKRGFASTVWTTVLPSLSGKGGVTVDTHNNAVDIQAIEDIMFALKRLCGHLGIDPALLGWGDLMSGGLGDGGFMRVSIQAAIIATSIRRGLQDGLYRLIDIHLAYKYGKVFPASKRPYKIVYNAVTTAMAREAADERLANVEYATSLIGMIQLFDASGDVLNVTNGDVLKNYIFTDVLHLPEEQAKELLAVPAQKITEDEQIMESIGQGMTKESITDMIYDVLLEMGRKGDDE